MDPVVILESHNPRQPGRSFRFKDCVGEVRADTVQEVIPALQSVERAADSGLHAAGFISYEAASGIDPLLATRQNAIAASEAPTRTLPLVWFGLFRTREEFQPSVEAQASPGVPLAWQPTLTRERYLEAVKQIQDFILAGDTYQVNFSHRLRSKWVGDPWPLYRTLCRAQGSSYCAYLDTGSHQVLSASPELFFRWKDGLITTSPMKGTSRRGRFWLEDERLKQELQTSSKNRAENVMIVDLMRNDLGRLAEVGSVKVDRLFEIETFETLLQMTSTISARINPEVRFVQLLSALFPSGSVTGAPKIRTMQLICDLESSPRGIYTGAIGFLSPGREAVFNVAIRTVAIERETGQLEFGLGGGITHSSSPADEYQESLDKALFLTTPRPEFSLLESLLYESDTGFLLLARHLTRLENSAAYFGFPFSSSEVITVLNATVQPLEPGSYKVRLLLDRTGNIHAESSPIQPDDVSGPAPAVIHLDEPVDSNDVFLFHKTTHRNIYESRTRQYPPGCHVILVNQSGEVTESATANVVVKTDDQFFTPPISAGLLAGTYREELLETGVLKERTLLPADLLRASEVYLINSVRRWMQVNPQLSRVVAD